MRTVTSRVFCVMAVVVLLLQISSRPAAATTTCTPPPPGPPPVTACTSVDFSVEFPECAPYVGYTSILTTDTIPIQGLFFFAEQQFSQIPSTLPIQCSDPLKEIVCKSIFQECVVIPLTVAPGVTIDVDLPRAPCKSICEKAGTFCSQLFSLGGEAPPDCNQLNPVTCQPVFVEKETVYPQLGGLAIPCQPSSLPDYPTGPFYCEPFNGKPKACKQYIDYGTSLSFSFAFTQDDAVATASASLEKFAALPDSCRFQAEEFLCRNVFRKCEAFTQFTPTFYWGRPLCHSACNAFNVQCGELFGLQGAPLTDCEEISLQLEANPSYPKVEQTFHDSKGDAMNVLCEPSQLKNQPKTFRCEKWTGFPSQCKPYLLDENNNKKEVFILDAFDMETRVNLTTTFVAILKDLPTNCRNYATEMICRTIFQECKSFDDTDLPTTYYIGKPPCKSICNNVRGCKKELKKVGIPIPDCDEEDSLTTGEVYPKKETKLLIPDHSYSVTCIDSIYNSGDNNNKRRFTRDENGVEVEVEPEEEEEKEEVEDSEEGEEPKTKSRGEEQEDEANTFNIAMSIAQALSRFSGASHQANVISGLQADGAFDNLVRSVSEQVARRVFV